MTITKFTTLAVIGYFITLLIAIALTFNGVLFGGLYLIMLYVAEPTNIHVILVFVLTLVCTWHVEKLVKLIWKKCIDLLAK